MADQTNNWDTQLSSDDTQVIIDTLKSIAKVGKRTHTHLPVPLLDHADEAVREQAEKCLQALILQIIPEKRAAHLLALVNNAIGAERGFIALADAEGFQTVTAHNITSEAIILDTVQAKLFYVQDHPDCLQVDDTPETEPQADVFRSVVVVPIIADDEVISILYSDVPIKFKTFSTRDLYLAQAIVDTVAPMLPPHLRSQLFG